MLVFILGLVPALILLDQMIKTYVENNVAKGSEKKVCGGRILIRKVYNKGMCLNAFQKYLDMVRCVSVAATALLTICNLGSVIFQKRRVLMNTGLGLMTAGAWSNTLDRCFRKYVIDYFGFETKKEKLRKITYNLGDMFLFAGGILVMLAAIFHKKK